MSAGHLIPYILYLIHFSHGSAVGGPRVTIKDGQLQGTTGENLDGERFFKFLGIPYGEPPLNELRFKPPKPVKPWIGLRNATAIGSSCLGRSENDGSEDCLYLNVYTRTLPNENPTHPRPVMVFFHGGAFVLGSSAPDEYGPEFLLLKNIVLVTTNYRLGALGFLSIDGTEVTGNMGLKDQTLALKWVRRNIKHFNGDPDNVTIFGQSAGGSSVHAHVLSAASRGLFHKAILQSGCVLNPWFWGSKNNAREIVEYLGKSAETEREALEILKQVPGREFFDAQDKLFDILYPYYQRPFSAVLESSNESAFLSRDLREVMNEGTYNQVPIMMGYTDTEGMIIEALAVPAFDMEDFIPFELITCKGSVERNRIKEILENIYSGSGKNKHYDAFTDGGFLVGLIQSLLYHLKTAKNPIFLYRMSISSSLNRFKILYHDINEPGACHADDLGYLFHSDFSPETISPGSLEDKAIRNFVGLWTNFAEFGNPTANDFNISWPAVQSEKRLELLDIGEELQVKEIPELKRMKAWKKIYRQWYGQ